MTDRISPTSDLGFRKILISPENKDVLQGIIGDFFNFRPALDDITITSPYDIKAYRENLKQVDGTEKSIAKFRETIQDVAADIKIAEFGAEIQIRHEEYFSERSLHYVCTRFCANYSRTGAMKQLSDGSYLRYSSLKPVYALNILGYPHFPGDDDALRVFTLYDRERHKSFDIEYLTIAYFELKKSRIETANQRHWQKYFLTGEAPDDAPEYIKKAAWVIEKANLTQEERDMYDQVEKWQEIHKNEIYSAHLEGKLEGKLEGEKTKSIAIALNALQMGMTIADISQLTGLTEDEIRKLAH
jgi:predicted transposase/invertase (TIGR01784 family)